LVKSSVIRELRAVQRYSINLPVCVTWHSAGVPPSSLNGFTRDISTRGMFVLADAEPAAGALLEFEIDLALDEVTPLVVVQGKGRVVRTQRASGSGPEQRAGFAVHNVWFRLREPEEGQALPADAPVLAPKPARSRDRHSGLTVVRQRAKTGLQGESE
jgi:hypothetical protein